MEIIKIKINSDVLVTQEISACIGYFDGIHIGHQQLIKKVIEVSNENHTIPALITFDPDPWSILHKEADLSHLTTMEERIAIGENLGLQKWIILHFDQEMADLSVEAFHALLKERLNIHSLICGFDYTYAKFGKGNIQSLKSQDQFNVYVVDAIMYQNEKISSSRIEKELSKGHIILVNELLDRPYQVWGGVIQGNQIGRTIGFPTANLKLEANYVLPKVGVYVAMIQVKDKQYEGFINIGYNPSFNFQDHLSIEANIFDFHEDIYDQRIGFTFLDWIRDECKFSGKDALIAQLKKDKLHAISIIQNMKKGG